MANFLKRLFDNDKKVLRRYGKIADKIEALSDDMAELTDEELQARTQEFKSRYANGESLDLSLIHI